MEKPLKVKLHILSPVHIGCDDVYEPTSFMIDEKTGKLIAFDPIDFIKSLSPQDRQKFTEICVQGNISAIVRIFKFISGRQIKGRDVQIANELVTHYKRVRDLPTNDEKKIRQELNQFAINRTAYNPHNNLPYIPGSSVKGAMRTAYLSKLAKDMRIKDKRQRDNAREFERQLLNGSFDTDPFRMVKASDFLPVGEAKTKIVYAVNKKKKESKFNAQGPPQIIETVKEGTIFEGRINIDPPEPLAKINKPIEAGELLRSIYNFYAPIADNEAKIIKEINASNMVLSRIKEKFKPNLGSSAFLIRIGRHSGAEAVTIEGNRDIKIIQGRGQHPKYDKQATTIWLASENRKPTTNNGLIPFGWAMLEIIK